ncbi:MAG: NUDIX hydrolase [Nocardioides sp.]|nr:NUDIX hydrolase [Nocardioides sp.]MCK5926905.1 hypothetical protein [Nocardioides sp.]
MDMVGTEGEVVTPRRAASVVVVRDGDEGVEVLLLRRTSKAAFAPDRFVFPGGSVDDSDQRVPLIGPPQVDECGRAAAPAEMVDQVAGVVDDVFVAGVRETCEEALILLALDSSGAPASVDHARAVRAAMASGASLAEAFDQRALRLDPASLVYHDRWITPEGAPRRFDTFFYYAATPAGQISEHDRSEAVDSVWVRPNEVLHSEEWTPRLLPPTRYHLSLCEQHADAAAVLAAARADAVHEPVRARLVSDGAGGTAVVVRPGAAPVPLGALPWREPGTNEGR